MSLTRASGTRDQLIMVAMAGCFGALAWSFEESSSLFVLLYPGFKLSLLLGFAVHELAHAAAATRLGDELARAEGRLSLNPLVHLEPIGMAMVLAFGVGWARPVAIEAREPSDRRRVALVAAAGPLSNLAMVVLVPIVALLLQVVLPGGMPGALAEALLSEAFWYIALPNLALFFFNLIPMDPLDGSKVLRGLLPARLAGGWERRSGVLALLGLVVLLLSLFVPVVSLLVLVAAVLSPLLLLLVLSARVALAVLRHALSGLYGLLRAVIAGIAKTAQGRRCGRAVRLSGCQ